jgi:hypothetical protein
VAEAARLTPAQLRKVARRSLAAAERSAEQVDAHENSSTKSEEDAAWEKARFTWHHKGDGTTSGHFTVPTFAGSVLIKAIQQIASPRRFAQQAAKQAKAGRAHAGQAARVDGAGRGAHTGQADPTGAARATPTDTDLRDQMREDVQEQVWRSFTDSGDWANRYGRALVELLEHLPTDQVSGKVAATIVVTLDHRTLLDQLAQKVAATDTGEPISASEARRLACNAGIVPAMLGGPSLPLDLGRQERFFTEHQRVALATRYDTCAAQGCDRPYAWAELHHEDPWHTGGSTDLDRAVPLCGHHHRRAHDPRYRHTVSTDARGVKSLTFTRRT